MKNETGGGLKSGSYVWVGMVVKKSEKLSTGFSDHERPRMTTLDQVRPHQKQWRKKGSTPTRGATLPPFVLVLRYLGGFEPSFFYNKFFYNKVEEQSFSVCRISHVCIQFFCFI